MKTEFLKEHGITDQEVINAIMAENGRDIEKAKGDVRSLEAERDGLKEQLEQRDTQLGELKNLTKDQQKLQDRITELETANNNAKTEYEGKLSAMQRENEIELKLRDAKAKNVKAVRALLVENEDVDKQIKALQSGESTAFLFESNETPQQTPPPKGTTPAVGTTTMSSPEPKSFADYITNALAKKG